MNTKLKALLLVLLQFLFILLLLINTSLRSIKATGLGCIVISVCLVIWAVASMQKSKLSIMPQPSQAASLVTSGPYRFIRHPMYTAVLLGSFGLIVHNLTWFRILILLLLIIVLVVKLSWEEKMLLQKFSQYKIYTKSTFRLFPFVY